MADAYEVLEFLHPWELGCTSPGDEDDSMQIDAGSDDSDEVSQLSRPLESEVGIAELMDVFTTPSHTIIINTEIGPRAVQVLEDPAYPEHLVPQAEKWVRDFGAAFLLETGKRGHFDELEWTTQCGLLTHGVRPLFSLQDISNNQFNASSDTTLGWRSLCHAVEKAAFDSSSHMEHDEFIFADPFAIINEGTIDEKFGTQQTQNTESHRQAQRAAGAFELSLHSRTVPTRVQPRPQRKATDSSDAVESPHESVIVLEDSEQRSGVLSNIAAVARMDASAARSADGSVLEMDESTYLVKLLIDEYLSLLHSGDPVDFGFLESPRPLIRRRMPLVEAGWHRSKSPREEVAGHWRWDHSTNQGPGAAILEGWSERELEGYEAR